ncbi:hypothetical protein OGAPHI_000457 [Ogataea philodendri]|uniref:Uncharacterized protein n=1 Tax=Ogataea philodendri TaxID=1378263 RepID=A0A9P8PH84_9ASCO|nr:uncharacterized protein OGAPHI_000457 [Ogataea philodendri]KAH3671752.1 hypothetical protein OGAPHI_000457 [Ogataea philodendri]
MNLCTFLQKAGHTVRWRSVDDGRRNDVENQSRILFWLCHDVLALLSADVLIELGHGSGKTSKMNVTGQNGDSDSVFSTELDQLAHQPVPFLLVVSSTPMVVQIIQQFDTTIEFVHQAFGNDSLSCQVLDRSKKLGSHERLDPDHSRVTDWHTEQHEQVFDLALGCNQLVIHSLKDTAVRLLGDDLMFSTLGSAVETNQCNFPSESGVH